MRTKVAKTLGASGGLFYFAWRSPIQTGALSQMNITKKTKAAAVTTAANTDAPVRLLSKGEVLDRVGVSYPCLWSWMREEKFPRSRKLGGKAAWIESEVEAWINALPVRRLKGDEEAA